MSAATWETNMTVWPRKSREMHSHHFDSTVWNDFAFRDDDVIVSTYAKSGTTWTQQIVSQLIFKGAENVPMHELSPWLDLRVPEKEIKLGALAAQTHRRCVKTHLPVEALVFSPRAKYIYVGRDGRDVLWSLYNHHTSGNAAWYATLNDTPNRVGPPIEPTTLDVVGYFRQWLEQDGFPFWSLWENVRSWWAIRDLPNVKFVHFANLKRDPEGEIRAIADFLGVTLTDAQWRQALLHCSFDYMKAHAELAAPLGGMLWEGGATTFINKGTNGRWQNVLPDADSRAYERRAIEELGAECAHWLATGTMAPEQRVA